MKKTRITSVSEYLGWVKTIHKSTIAGIEFDIFSIYYRGQACSTLKLKAGIFRNENLPENEILMKANKLLWQELNQYSTYWDKLSLFQHFGLPTRLLDVTTNPLIALFFACKDDKFKNRNGAVYVCYKSECTSINIEKLCEIIFSIPLGNMYTDIKRLGLDDTQENIYSITYNHILEPPISNLRLAAQSGAYIFTRLFTENQGLYYKYNGDVANMFEKKCAIIPASSKNEILKELRECGIHE